MVTHCQIIDILTCEDELDHVHIVLRVDADSPPCAEIRIERERLPALRDSLNKVITLLTPTTGAPN